MFGMDGNHSEHEQKATAAFDSPIGIANPNVGVNASKDSLFAKKNAQQPSSFAEN